MRNLLNGLGVKFSEPTILYEDNQGCIQLSENTGDHHQTKHIDICHRFIQEKVLEEIIVLSI